MTNHIINDLGETVIACGAPGSAARLKAQYPLLIARLRAIDTQARELFCELIQRADFVSAQEIRTLLAIVLDDDDEVTSCDRH